MNLTRTGLHKWMDTLVQLRKPLLVIAMLWGCSLALMLLSAIARAEMRCNCAEVIDTCSATVNLDNTRIGIVSDTNACARVDYLIEGQPFTALVVGGSAEMNWSGQPMHSPQIVVENCRVCADASATQTMAAAKVAATGDSKPADNTEPKPMVKVMPEYPREAWTNRIEGDVLLEYSVNAAGKVENIRVLKSTNSIFVVDSMDALSRFRFTPAQKDGQPVATPGQREQFRFRIPDGINPTVSSNEA